MKKLPNLIEEWVREGLLTQSQHEKILEYEKNRHRAGKPQWVLYGFLILGICIVGIGLISLIAANWEKIPGGAKIAADFIVLCAVAFGVYMLDRAEGGWSDIFFDALSAFFILLCMASIGLVSQVFHTGGQLYQALLFWLIIVLPLTLRGKKYFLFHLWAAGFLTMLVAWSSADSSLYDQRHAFVLFFLTLPFFLLFIVHLLFLAAKTGKARWAERFGGAFIFWLMVSFIVMLFFVELSFLTSHFEADAGLLPFIILYACIVASLVFTLFSSFFTKKEKIIVFILIAVFTIYCLPLIKDGEYSLWLNSIVPHSDSEIIEKIAGPVFSIPATMLLCMLFIMRDQRRLFNIGMIAVGLRFLIIYFQVLGDLATTALGLIVTGAAIVGISFLWFKKRSTVERWLGGLLK